MENGTHRAIQGGLERFSTLYLRARRPQLRIMPLINNWNGKQWEGEKLARMLAEPAARSRAIDGLVSYAENHRFCGISVDFGLGQDDPASRRNFEHSFGVGQR